MKKEKKECPDDYLERVEERTQEMKKSLVACEWATKAANAAGTDSDAPVVTEEETADTETE